MIKEVEIICICGFKNIVQMVGNRNADGKGICNCGRHITIHLRKEVSQQDVEADANKCCDNPMVVTDFHRGSRCLNCDNSTT